MTGVHKFSKNLGGTSKMLPESKFHNDAPQILAATAQYLGPRNLILTSGVSSRLRLLSSVQRGPEAHPKSYSKHKAD
jgi:hypothetical protein